MSGKNIYFGDKKIKKASFTKKKKKKNAAKIDGIDVNKILVFQEEPYATKDSFKYFIWYNDDDVIRPLCIKLPQITGYIRKFDDNTTMSFRVSNKQLLKKYNQTWKKVWLNIKFDSEPVCRDNNKYIKNKNKIIRWYCYYKFSG